MSIPARWHHPAGTLRDRIADAAGGSLRARVVLLLACALGLDTADTSMIGAIAGKLESALHLSNTELGLLAAAPSLFAAVATIPVGVLTDHVNRVRMVVVSTIIWAAAMVASGAAGSFEVLLLTRLALGAATATAGPTLSSLVGDFFPARERGRIYGMILSGELIGAGVGFVSSGLLASALSWRAAFFFLAVPSLAVAIAFWRLLPEPERGGGSRLQRGATSFRRAARRGESDGDEQPERSLVQRVVDEQAVAPQADLVLGSDPAQMSLWAASRYVLRIRTNVILIVASALGYFYFAGVQTFGLVFVSGRYAVSHAAATLLLGLLGLGALVGVVAGGQLADRLLARGRVNARIMVGGGSYVLAAALFLPALLGRTLVFAMPFYILAAAAFAARNPPLDAARLDVMHHRLWGRAEAIRTLLRRTVVATAPLVFGVLADTFVSGTRGGGGQHGFGAGASVAGLHDTFLLLLLTLAASGVLTFWARATYPRDVATAAASEEATRRLLRRPVIRRSVRTRAQMTAGAPGRRAPS